MYELIKLNEYAMTRDVELINLDTGTTDVCFDDSSMVINDFGFMEIGNEYDCKILLFGNRVTKLTKDAHIKCKIIKELAVGNRALLEVSVNNDIYYIDDNCGEEYIFFNVTRKDIIQVGDVVHHNLLRKL